MEEDDLRLAVADDSFNLHVRGQEETPLLAAETSRSLSPKDCSWRIDPPTLVGTQKVRRIKVILRKAAPGFWREDLFKRAFV